MVDTHVEGMQGWPERRWILGVVGALVGACLSLLSRLPYYGGLVSPNPFAFTFGFLGFGLALGFVLARNAIKARLIFAILSGLVIGLAFFWNDDPRWSDTWEAMRVFSAAIAVAIAAPLFNAWCDAGRPMRGAGVLFPVERVHEHGWTCLLLWFCGWAFAGLVLLTTVLLGALFDLVGITFLQKLLRDDMFVPALCGGAFGLGLALLRERTNILIAMQSLARTILSILAPIVSIALVIFLAGSLIAGISTLWEETKATTPLLLITVALALILANAVIGDSQEEESKTRLIRYGAILLGITLLPMGLFAAASVGIRINQYGLTPDRLWALLLTIIATVIGLGYAVTMVQQRSAWPRGIRQTNVRLGVGIVLLAILLSTPLVSFSRISVSDQVARLESGTTPPEKFSWEMMRFTYGKAGRAALARLAQSGKTPDIRQRAAAALALKDQHWSESQAVPAKEATKQQRIEQLKLRLSVRPVNASIPNALAEAIVATNDCNEGNECLLTIIGNGERSAALFSKGCESCNAIAVLFEKDSKQGWKRAEYSIDEGATADLFSAQKVEVRDVQARQIFVDGQPVGEPSVQVK